MISATFHTNIYIKAFNFGGGTAFLLGLARAGAFRLDISDQVITETLGIMREKFQRDPYSINDVRQKLEALCNRVLPTQTVDGIKEDPDDNRIIECAMAAKSEYIVTEDQDLLRLGRYAGVEIMSMEEFTKRLAKERRRQARDLL